MKQHSEESDRRFGPRRVSAYLTFLVAFVALSGGGACHKSTIPGTVAGTKTESDSAASEKEPADVSPWIIDTHTHFQDANYVEYQRQVDLKPRDPRDRLGQVLAPTDYQPTARKLGIQAALIVAVKRQNHPRWTDWGIELVRRSPMFCGYVARADFTTPEFLANHKRHHASGVLKGYRIQRAELRACLDSADGCRHLAQLEEDELVLDLLVQPETYPDVIELAKAYPHLKIMLNHCFRARMRAGQPSDIWYEAIAACAKYPNVYCKFSSLVNFSSAKRFSREAPTNAAAYKAVFSTVYDAFGEDRLVFGTNWPVCEHYGPTQTVVDIAKEFLQAKGPAIYRKVLRENAIRIYRCESSLGRIDP